MDIDNIGSLSEIENEANAALRQSCLAYHNIDAVTTPATTDDELRATEVIRIYEVVSRLIKSKDNEFYVIDRGRKGTEIVASKVGRRLLAILKIDIGNIESHYPRHKLHPYVELFADLISDAAIQDLIFRMEWKLDINKETMAETLNQLISRIRTGADQDKFKSRVHNFARSSMKNFRSFMRYVASLFEERSRLLILRIDLGYMKRKAWPVDSEVSIGLQDVQRHRDKLLLEIRRNLTRDSLVGYAWKLEFAQHKSFHIHLMVFLDGSAVREDVTIARIIGEKWENEITEGKGLYHNCNAFKEGYKSCGIGMAHYSDVNRMEGLHDAVSYMTKPDFFIKMALPDNDRTFGKGGRPKKKGIGGRPRASKDIALPFRAIGAKRLVLRKPRLLRKI